MRPVRRRHRRVAWTRRVVSCGIALGCLVLLAGEAGARDDWELWTEFRWKKALSERLALQGVSSGRLRGGMGELYQHFEEFGLGYQARPWVKLEGAYQWNQIDRERTHDGLYEHRLYLAATPSAALGRVRLENRHRMELRRLNGAEGWRYRTRLKAGLRAGEGRWWRMRPYVSDELFYGFRAGEFLRNRAQIGVERPLTARVGVDVFYLVESNRAGRDWAERHGLGLAATLTF